MEVVRAEPVELYIYDLTNGLATVLSPSLLGRDGDALVITDGSDKDSGERIDGVWHTSVVVFGREYFYGGHGITSCAPVDECFMSWTVDEHVARIVHKFFKNRNTKYWRFAKCAYAAGNAKCNLLVLEAGSLVHSRIKGSTQLGPPQRVERLGETFLTFSVFMDFMQELANTTFKPECYHLLRHNCNHFSEEVAVLLCGAHVPKFVLAQAQALPPPLRIALSAILDEIAPDAQQAVYARGVRHSRRESPDYTSLNEQVERARAESLELGARRDSLAAKLQKRLRKQQKKLKRNAHNSHQHNAGAEDSAEEQLNGCGDSSSMAEALVEEPAAGRSAGSELERRRSDEMKRRQTDPPIVYKDIDGETEFNNFVKALEESNVELSEEERQSADELRQYLVLGEGSWVLGDEWLAFIGRILNSDWSGLCSADSAVRLRCGATRCLVACALREDVSLVLHQDRRHHALLNYAHRIDALTLDEQKAVALFMCNLFEHVSSSEWLLYISEWEANGTTLSNIRVTTKVCVHALLSDDEELRERGAALLHNIATKEVKTVRLRASAPLRALLPPSAKSKVFDEVCVELGMAALQVLSGGAPEAVAFLALHALARLAAHSPDVPQLIAMVGPDPAAYRGTSARIDEQLDLLARVK